MSQLTGPVTILQVEQRSGVKNGKPWTLFKVKASDGNSYDTFDAPLAQKANSYLGHPVTIGYDTRVNVKDGVEYTNYDLKDVLVPQGGFESPVASGGNLPSQPLPAPAPALIPQEGASTASQEKDARITRLSSARTAFEFYAGSGVPDEQVFRLAARIEHFANTGLLAAVAAQVPDVPSQPDDGMPWDD